MVAVNPRSLRRIWPDYAAVWRWHFYAGLLCLPFFCWLAITGSIYLFRPDIEALLDRPYESLHLDGPRAAPSDEARAALAAMPGSAFSRYEPPATPTGAAQIVVARDGHLYRVIVHPRTLQAMSIGRDDHRPMELVAHLHGQLLLGDRGSNLVEMAGCWGVVMIITGLFLWFPRGTKRLGGLLYPRLGQRGRLFWRDLHAVTGLWISAVTLFLLVSGLPWASNWGNYFTWLRNHAAVTAGQPDWSLGGKAEPLPQIKPVLQPGGMVTMSAAEMAAMAPPPKAENGSPDLQALDKVVPVAAGLHVPRPVWILPPPRGSSNWIVWSRIQNRPRRVAYAIAPDSEAVVGTKTFANDDRVDQIVNVAIATHEGQLFGRANQAILLVNALGVVVVTISAVVMWWKRRPAHLLGAPPASTRPYSGITLGLTAVFLAVLFPLFGASLVVILVIERGLLSRYAGLSHWLGLDVRPSAV